MRRRLFDMCSRPPSCIFALELGGLFVFDAIGGFEKEPGAFSSLELLGVRLVDLDTLSSMSGADSALRTTTSMALQGFRSFAQVARHALDEASNYWWSSTSDLMWFSLGWLGVSFLCSFLGVEQRWNHA